MSSHGQPAQPTDGLKSAVTPVSVTASWCHQLVALSHAIWHELCCILPCTAREIRHWRARAAAAADASLREDALVALMGKRVQAEGAALLATLSRRRCSVLAILFLRYQLVWDFLDTVHERAPGIANGERLHGALEDSLNPCGAIRSRYELHPWRDDSGYLAALSFSCRVNVGPLPSYSTISPTVLHEASRSRHVLAANHGQDIVERDEKLEMLAAADRGTSCLDPSWFELTAAASAGLAIFALLAQAASLAPSRAEVATTQRIYSCSIGTVATMLDSYADLAQDTSDSAHVYIAHYSSFDRAVSRTSDLIRRSMTEVRALSNSHRHVVVIACMVAMYLTEDSALAEGSTRSTRKLASSAGSLTIALMPIVRLWRILYAVRSS